MGGWGGGGCRYELGWNDISVPRLQPHKLTPRRVPKQHWLRGPLVGGSKPLVGAPHLKHPAKRLLFGHYGPPKTRACSRGHI